MSGPKRVQVGRKGIGEMRISELDDIEKEALLGMVIRRARADLNDGRPLTELRGKQVEREYCPGCEASVTETDYEAGWCTQCGFGLITENGNDDAEKEEIL